MEEDKENQVVQWEVLGYEGDEGMNLKDVWEPVMFSFSREEDVMLCLKWKEIGMKQMFRTSTLNKLTC